MKAVSISLLLLVTVGACKKNNVTDRGSSDIFPNKVGDRWHYLVKDTTESYNDSTATQYDLYVNIVGRVPLSYGDSASVWQFIYPGSIDTNYVFQLGDTIRFEAQTDRTNQSPDIVATYIVPFTLGASWPYVTPSLSDVMVVGQDSIQVGANSFQAWEIRGDAGYPDGLFRIDEWFVDHVGFVRKYFNPYSELLPIRHILDWTLVSYQLN